MMAVGVYDCSLGGSYEAVSSSQRSRYRDNSMTLLAVLRAGGIIYVASEKNPGFGVIRETQIIFFL